MSELLQSDPATERRWSGRTLPLLLVLSCIALLLAGGTVASAMFGNGAQRAINDRLELATDLSFVELPTTDRIDGSGATTEVGDPVEANTPKATLWWVWEPQTTALMNASTQNNDVDAFIYVYEYDEGGAPELTSLGSGFATAGAAADVNFFATAGDRYAIMIDQQSNAGAVDTGVVELTLAFAGTLPGNDDFSSASPFAAFPFSETGNTAAATNEANEPDHGSEPPLRSVWWTWTAPSSQPITLDTCGSSFDTTLHVYSGSGVDSLTSIAGNDDTVLACDPNSVGFSEVQFQASAGSTYHIALDGFVGAAGPFTLNGLAGAPIQDGLVVLDEPCVIYASQAASAPALSGPISGQEVRTIQVQGAMIGQGGANICVPDAASSAIFRISSIDPLTEGNLIMTPAGVPAAGGAGVVNYGGLNGLNNANTVTVPLSASGQVDIEANAGILGAVPTTDVRLSLIGYYSPDVSADVGFFPMDPCVVVDSRPNKGPNDAFDGPNNDGLWPVGGSFPDFDVVGAFDGGQGGNGVGTVSADCGVPNTAGAVMLNVVAVNVPNGSPSGYLSVGTGGLDPIAEPSTPFADLNPKMNNGATTIVKVSAAGTVAIDIDGDVGAETNIRVELLGYFETGGGLQYTPVTPCAFFDTRTNNGRLAAGVFAGKRKHGEIHTTTYKVTGAAITVDQGGIVPSVGDPTVGTCGVPDGASAVLINLEAVNAVQEGNYWVAAASTTAGAATAGGVLNFNNVTPKMNNANAVVVPVSPSGEIDLEVNAGSFTPVGTEINEARGVVLGYFN